MTPAPGHPEGRPTTFLLVHGACHGAWCWQRLEHHLHRKGHRTVTVELPSDVAGLTVVDYASAVAQEARLHANGEDVVLVAHSMAGLIAPFVAESVPLSHVVFLNSLLQQGAFGGVPWPDQSELPMLVMPLDQLELDEQGRFLLSPEMATDYFFGPDCSPEDTTWALTQLRPQAISALYPPPRLVGLPEHLPRTYILGNEDQAVLPSWSRWAAKALLDAELVELPGGHSPQLAQPAQLADVLDAIALSGGARKGGAAGGHLHERGRTVAGHLERKAGTLAEVPLTQGSIDELSK